VTWVPNEMLERMDEEDREGYKKVEGRFNGTLTPGDKEEDGECQEHFRREAVLNKHRFCFCICTSAERGEVRLLGAP